MQEKIMKLQIEKNALVYLYELGFSLFDLKTISMMDLLNRGLVYQCSKGYAVVPKARVVNPVLALNLIEKNPVFALLWSSKIKNDPKYAMALAGKTVRYSNVQVTCYIDGIHIENTCTTVDSAILLGSELQNDTSFMTTFMEAQKGSKEAWQHCERQRDKIRVLLQSSGASFKTVTK